MSCTRKAKSNCTTTGTVLFLIIFIFQASESSAQNQIPDSLVNVRINYIQTMLNQGKPNASIWWNGWLYGYSAATVGQGVAGLMSDKLKSRQDLFLSAATTLVGAVGQLLTPMIPVSAPGKLALIPGDTPEERIIKLNKAEELFEASANREKDGRSWKMHAASGVVNLSSGLITWLGFDRTLKAGIINFAINTAVTEAQIWTQPTKAMKDYKNYREKYQNGLPSALNKPKSQLYLNAFPGGLALKLIF